MMRCSDVRWRLNAFLSGGLDASASENVRRHLDICPDCAVALAEDHRLEGAVIRDVSSPDLFTEKLLALVPESTTSRILFRYLCGVFAASSLLAVSFYAFWRHFTHAGHAANSTLNWSMLTDLQSSLPWLTKITASPVFNYTLLGLAATVLTIVLIVLVDSPRNRGLEPVKQYLRKSR
jgi:hypothetical protein